MKTWISSVASWLDVISKLYTKKKKIEKGKKSLKTWILEDLANNLTLGQLIHFQSNLQPSALLPTLKFSISFSLISNFLVGTAPNTYMQLL